MTKPGKMRGSFAGLLDAARLKDALEPGSHVLVAVSGGADSVALLRGLRESSRRFQLSCIHVNHGLRAEAVAEEGFVRELCAGRGIDFYVRRLSGADRVSGGSAEAHWRQLRYAAFAEVMAEIGADVLALGHNADDLAETFLFHLVRGTGVDGLQFHFETAVSGLRIVRPLWKTRRAEIEEVLRAQGQTWIEDLSNENVRHSRNLIRREVLPVLQKINPDAAGAIVRAADAIGEVAGGIDGGNLSAGEPGSERLNLDRLRGEGMSAGAVAALRGFVDAGGMALDSRQTEQAIGLIQRGKGGTVALSGGRTLVITQDFAWISRQNLPLDVDLAREHMKRFGGFYAGLQGPVAGEGAGDGEQSFLVTGLDGQEVVARVSGASGEVVLRNRGAGDKVGSRVLKKVINEQRVPWYLRDFLVFVVGLEDGRVVGVIAEDGGLVEAVKLYGWAGLEFVLSDR